MLSKLLRGVHRTNGLTRSWARIAWLRALYPGLVIEGRVTIARHCEIYVAPGSTLVIRNCAVSQSTTLITAPGAVLVIDADFIGMGSVIVARERVTIEAGSKLAEYTTVRDADHDHSIPLSAMVFRSRPVAIGRDVWVAAKATVLAGVTVGDGATLAAGAVVTRDVAVNQVVAGVPARPINR